MKIDPGGFAFGFIAEGIKRLRQRRRRKRRLRELGIPDDKETGMDSLKGAAKSKLIWLGVAQVAYGILELWANGNLSAESVGPVISGAITIWLRTLTTGSLADKAR